ncbi:MAG: Uma2 family endonuclease, partial [Gemmataceae bacterium]
MTTALNAPPGLSDGVRLLTVADLAAMPDHLPSGPVKWELHDGRLVSMVLPGYEHGVLQNRIGTFLTVQGDYRGHGQTLGEIGLVLRRNPDRVVGPDACFLCASPLPPQLSAEGYFTTMPDLAVEVRSRNDTLADLQRKADEYLAAGVACV